MTVQISSFRRQRTPNRFEASAVFIAIRTETQLFLCPRRCLPAFASCPATPICLFSAIYVSAAVARTAIRCRHSLHESTTIMFAVRRRCVQYKLIIMYCTWNCFFSAQNGQSMKLLISRNPTKTNQSSVDSITFSPELKSKVEAWGGHTGMVHYGLDGRVIYQE